MLTLLSEIHFWSTQDDLSIKDTDYGAFKYNDRKDDNSSDNLQSKKSYSEKRNYHWTLTNKRPSRLKDKLKEFEDQISQNKVVYYKWVGNSILQLMLCTGLIITICVNINTGDIQKVTFDKYLIGKLQTGCISDVLITRSHLLCTYNDTKMTLVHFTRKPATGDTVSVKLTRLEPRIVVAELAGPSGRRLERKLSASSTGDRLLVWWRCTRDDVYPWSPLVKDQDRANIHIYTLYGIKLELLCYRRTEFELLDVLFDKNEANVIHCVEQKISRRGAVSVEVSTYEIVRNKLQQQMLNSIPLQTHVSCHALNTDSKKLVLGCIDGSVVLFDCLRSVNCVVKAVFIPTLVTWHPDSAVLIVANERSQIQWFDLALNCIKSQTISEDLTPANILDLSSYFKQQPSLIHMLWATKYGNDAMLLLVFERGPLALLRLIDNGALSADNLVATYIRTGQIELALSVLQALDWENNGTVCLSALQHVISHLFRTKFTNNVEQQIQRALGIFYAPLRPISSSTKSEFGDQVADITRRFFHLLIRHKLYEKAFCLAIDIGDHDLFMDLYHCAKLIPDRDMASAALSRANELLDNISDSEDSHSLCSRSDCSQCSDSEVEAIVPRPRVVDSWTMPEQSHLPPLPTVQNVFSAPPLPVRPQKPFISFTNEVQDAKSFASFTNEVQDAKPFVAFTNEVQDPKPFVSFGDNAQDTITPLLHNTHLETKLNEKKTLHPIRFKPPTFQKHDDTFSHNYFSSNLTYPKLCTVQSQASAVHVHKTVSMNIPPAPTFVNAAVPVKVNVPLNILPSHNETASEAASSKGSGEKNVKFSDTVTAFIVPEIPRSEKLKTKRVSTSRYVTDPKQELQDSLPLCHPNDDYLKDFTPISSHNEEEETGTKIKVVHFGMV